MSGPTPLERIRELSYLDGEDDLSALRSFSYEWSGSGDGSGYEVFQSGNFEYRGVFHPGDGCCRGNPCRYCGMTWHSPLCR